MNPPDPAPRSGAPKIDEDSLLAIAREVLANAHSPYSGVKVGAALLDADGVVHRGCNVENASYGLTICAERVAFTRAVADGAKEFVAIAIATDQPKLFTPCGACRQVLTQLPRALDLVVICAGGDGKPERWTLGELLPHAFTPEDLKR